MLAEAARHARMLIVGRTAESGPQRLLAAQANLSLARGSAARPSSYRVVAAVRDGSQGRRRSRRGGLSAEAVEFAFRAAADREGDLIVVRAGRRRITPGNDDDVDHSWISRADHTISDAVARWTGEFPQVKVTRFVSSRPAADALVRESQDVGLVVVGAHDSSLPVPDPVARRCVAAMTCPVAIVAHHPTAAEREPILSTAARRRDDGLQPLRADQVRDSPGFSNRVRPKQRTAIAGPGPGSTVSVTSAVETSATSRCPR